MGKLGLIPASKLVPGLTYRTASGRPVTYLGQVVMYSELHVDNRTELRTFVGHMVCEVSALRGLRIHGNVGVLRRDSPVFTPMNVRCTVTPPRLKERVRYWWAKPLNVAVGDHQRWLTLNRSVFPPIIETVDVRWVTTGEARDERAAIKAITRLGDEDETATVYLQSYKYVLK